MGWKDDVIIMYADIKFSVKLNSDFPNTADEQK